MEVFSLLMVAGLAATSLSSPFPAARETPDLECPEGWRLLDRVCFLIADAAGTWDEGQAYCNQREASLATIATQAQQDALSVMLKQGVWIGFNNLEKSNKFVWADDSEHSYTSWHPEEPDNPEQHHCVEMSQPYNYLWNDLPCDSIMQFLCSKTPDLIMLPRSLAAAAAAVMPPTVCEEGWEMFEDSMCYKVSQDRASWPRARDACLAQYAQLASVTSEKQHNFLVALLNDDTWIGLNDREEEGTFTWPDGTEPGYTNWGRVCWGGQPDNTLLLLEGEDCVEMSKECDYKWNDRLCSTNISFVCQKPPTTTTTCVPPEPMQMPASPTGNMGASKLHCSRTPACV